MRWMYVAVIAVLALVTLIFALQNFQSVTVAFLRLQFSSPLALLIITYLIPSIHIRSFGTALIVAVVLGLINTILRPVLILLTLPVTIVTLGLFILVVNALCFWLCASLLKGFEVSGFWSAFFGSILYSIVSWLLSALIFGNRSLG